MSLKDFGDDWNGGVYGVRNHKNEGLGASLSNPSGEVTNDTSIDLKKAPVRIFANARRGRRVENTP